MDNSLNDTLKKYIDDLSSLSPIPAGGNAIAVINAFACSLMLKSLQIAIIRKSDDLEKPLQFKEKLQIMQTESLKLAAEDSEKFKQIIAAQKANEEELEEALKQSAELSLKISRLSLDLCKMIDDEDIEAYSNLITNVGISIEFAYACFNGGIMNYKINIKGVKNQVVYNNLKSARDELVNEFESVYRRLSKKIKSLI